MFAIATKLEGGGDPRHGSGIGYGCAPSSTLQTDSVHCSQNFRNADDIVGCRSQNEEPFHQVPPAMSGLAQAADGLDPAERLFDALSFDHADGIAEMAGGAPIDCGATMSAIVLRDMRGAAA